LVIVILGSLSYCPCANISQRPTLWPLESFTAWVFEVNRERRENGRERRDGSRLLQAAHDIIAEYWDFTAAALRLEVRSVIGCESWHGLV
jgi:hypothetical protein